MKYHVNMCSLLRALRYGRQVEFAKMGASKIAKE